MNTYIVLVAVFVIAISIGLILMPYIVGLSRELHLYDLPDSRKVHTLPIPRIGGIAFLPIATIAIALTMVVSLRLGYDVFSLWDERSVQHVLAYIAGGMMLFVIGLYDDIHGVGYRVKFCIQIISAALLCISGLWVADFSHVFFLDKVPFWIGMPATIGATVYLTNAMNLIDGIDGLASGLSCISLIVITILNLICGDVEWAMMSVAMLGVVLSFYYYNVFDKQNKIFMGDAGSLTLGFTLSFLVLHFWQWNGVWNPHFHNIGIVAVSTLVIPLFDVVRVFASRLRDGRNPFLPDKNHIHHKLLRAGLNARMTMVTILLLDLSLIAINYLMASFVSQTLMVVTDVILFVVMHLVINFFIFKKERPMGIKYDKIF